MSRITERFSGLKGTGRRAFIPYITAGDPDLATTEQLMLAPARART
jgi:tryptophan synthase alpha chain